MCTKLRREFCKITLSSRPRRNDEWRDLILKKFMRKYCFYVYILTNRSGTLYTGFTNNVDIRQWQHANKINSGITAKYNIDKLIYHEEYQYVEEAIRREKQIKNWNRKKKLDLIRRMNPKFEDLLKH